MVASRPRGRGLARRPANRYKGPAPGAEGATGAVADFGRVITQIRGFSVFDITGKRVALYARHSTAGQDRSVPAQIHRLRAVATAGDATVVAEYADEAVTGAVLRTRAAVQDMLANAADGDFEAVLIEDLSRISRDQADVATIHKHLSFHDVALVSVTEGAIGALHIGLKGTMNSLFLTDLSDKVRRGQFAAVRTGRIPGGRIYGYEIVRPEGTLETGLRRIDPKEASVVRRIFAEAECGKAIRKIAADLNRDGIPSSRGGRWTATTILGDRPRGRGLLRLPMYVGRVVFGRFRTVRHPVTGQRIHRLQPQSKWLVTAAPELAIISEEQFDRVQQRIDGDQSRPPPRRRRKAGSPPGTNSPPRYLTSGRTWCASCGGRVTTAHTGYMVCRNWKEHRACDQRHLFRRELIIEATLDYFTSTRCTTAAHAAFRGLLPTAARSRSAHRAIDTATDFVERARAATDGLAAEIAEIVGMGRVRDHLATCDCDIAALQDNLQRLRIVTAGTLPILGSRSIAAALQARAATAVARIRTGIAAKEETELIESLVESIHVSYQGPGRQGLKVRPVIAAHAAYHVGLAEVDPALLRVPRRGRSSATTAARRGAA